MAARHKTNRLTPRNIFNFLVTEERRSSVLLLAAAVAAMVIANSHWSDSYFSLLGEKYSFGWVTLDLKHWVNEGLMAIFFLVVMLEVKREFIDGELRSWRKASFVVFAACGGMLLPAVLFAALNPYPPQNLGWAIPTSTDTAIAVGVLGLLGRRIPKNLRVFLLALAIIDDIVSILIIGLLYSRPTNMFVLLLALVVSLVLFATRTSKYRALCFPLCGFVIWYCLLLAGVSGAAAGVIIGLIAPLVTSRSNAVRLQTAEKVEDKLLPFTAYVVVPLFVFVNAGLDFGRVAFAGREEIMIFLGVVLGLAVGKPLGIFAAGWLAAKLRIAHKPRGISWPQISGIGFVAGIGFTISLLVTDLSYGDAPSYQHAAILGVFTASMVAGVVGLLLLRAAKHAKTT
jgi:Na+:H+ antiporter, NhaA family